MIIIFALKLIKSVFNIKVFWIINIKINMNELINF